MDKHFFYELANRYLDDTATPDERKLVEAYYEHLAGEDAGLPEEKKKLLLAQVFSRVQEVIPPSPVRTVMMRTWWKVAAAAAIVFVVCGLWFVVDWKPNRKSPIVNRQTNDVLPPQSIKAVITLADGRTISLDSLTTLSQANVQLIKTVDGRIAYSGSATEIVFNTLTNPRGSKVIDMTLADGSRVWLNAGSSVTYPVAFIGKERKVSITGEGYFEIAHDPSKPFKVSKGETIVEVLGTHFNVNAYDDDKEIKVTLLEGSVKVLNEAGEALLKPGQQASLTTNHSEGLRSPSDKPQITSSVDVDAVMAWKNGMFLFNGSSVEEIMSQLSRWYEVDVVYEDRINKSFVAKISRDMPVSRLLALLEKTKLIKFKVEGNRVTVMKY